MTTRRLVWKALLTLFQYDLRLSKRDFKELYQGVRDWPITDKPWADADTERICHAVALACMWYPKEAPCLQRSVVAVRLLRDEGVPARMVIGAQQVPFKSHAWVEVNGRVVNDKPHICATYARLETSDERASGHS